MFPFKMSSAFMDTVDILNMPAETDTGVDLVIDLQPSSGGGRQQYDMFPHEMLGPFVYLGYVDDLRILDEQGPWDMYILKKGDLLYKIISARQWGNHHVLLLQEMRNI